jgi:outer membrane receptor for ferrienterochelin and colicin
MGGFSAEYGNAQSGVVNVIMKEGDEKYNGHFNSHTLHLDNVISGNYVYDPSTQENSMII